jgi:hypothetical protein
MRATRIVIFAVLLCTIAYLCVVVYQISCAQRGYKEQLVELSRIKYGLFNIDQWKLVVADVLTKKVIEFNLDAHDETILKGRIEEFLYEGIDKLELAFREERKKGIKGKVQSMVAGLTNIFETMEKQVPVIANDVLAFMERDYNRETLNKFILGRLDRYLDKTFSETDYGMHDAIIKTHGCANREETVEAIVFEMDMLSDDLRFYLYALAGAVGLLFLLMIFLPKLTPAEIILGSATALCMLITGLLLPMIELDARIEKFDFELMGEPVNFSDQVLYYQSKSILEVVELLLEQSRVEVILVGILVLSFSVLLPLMKILSTFLFYIIRALRKNWLLLILIFKTGKWSMADVMAVAIIMSFIGFDSIISNQLRQMANNVQHIDILTTNHSSLQPGFYFFTAFVILSLLISQRMFSQVKEPMMIETKAERMKRKASEAV